MSYRIVNGRAFQVGSLDSLNNQKSINNTVNKTKDKSFSSILNEKIERQQGYTLSKHATERLESVNFTNDDMKSIEKGFEIASQKGSRNSLFLYKDVALVASIENKTVITAVDKDRAKDNCFTNIDSVVIL
ncbi:MAG: TIGR02530 family flagellar biosynthesis protein [Clostridium sp.]